jgi:MtN3 and saliva related transmembrane protein
VQQCSSNSAVPTRIFDAYGRAIAEQAAGTDVIRVMDMTTIIGVTAAACTTASYIPQLHKCWKTGQAGDLSLRMFLILALGIGLWVIYGFQKGDFVIILSNAVSLCFLGGILIYKIREISSHHTAERNI